MTIDVRIVKEKYGSAEVLRLPLFTDVHVHLREPGFEYKETIETGSLAAASAGYGTVCAMPNLKPVPDSLENLRAQLDIISRKAKGAAVLPYGAITCREQGRDLSDMEAMAPYVCGYSDDGVGLNDRALMKEAMVRAKALGKIIAAHCEDMTLRKGGYIHAGKYAAAHGHKGISSESEWRPLERDLELAAETGCSYHVCHVSAKESLNLIRQAKKTGIDVTCETAPHYLILSEEDLREDAAFKMNPPLRSLEDREALREGVLDGTIDMLATDHAPHTLEEKSRGLEKSAMGISGLEAAFPVLYTGLVEPGLLTMERLVELMAMKPAQRFQIAQRSLETDYALWELDTEYEIRPEGFISMGRVTPFAGMKVKGRCLKTVIGGKTVWTR